MCGRIVVTRPLDVLAAYFDVSEVAALRDLLAGVERPHGRDGIGRNERG